MQYLDVEIRLERHDATPGTPTATWRTPTSAAGRSSTCSRGSAPPSPARRRRPRLRPRQPDRAARRPLAGRRRDRRRLQPGDDRGGARGRPGVDLRGRRPARLGRPHAGRAPVDVLVSNATLQWVPDHLDLLPRLVDRLAPGGWFAFQVPGNFDEPSHTIRAELAAEAPYAEHAARRRRARRATTRRLPRGAGRPRAARSTCGRRRTSTCSPATTRSSPGSPAPAPGRRCRRCPTTCGRTSRTSSSARLREAYPADASGASCCRSAGSSSSRRRAG